MKYKFLLVFISFLVTWRLAYWVSEPCDLAGKKDGYGNYQYTGCLVNHGHWEYELHSAVFNTKEAAEKFVKDAPYNTQDFVIQETLEK